MKRGGGNRRRRIGVLLAGFFLVGEVLALDSAAPALPPKPDRYVTDLAKVLPESRASALNEKLAAFLAFFSHDRT